MNASNENAFVTLGLAVAKLGDRALHTVHRQLTGGEALYHYGGRTAQFCLGLPTTTSLFPI